MIIAYKIEYTSPRTHKRIRNREILYNVPDGQGSKAIEAVQAAYTKRLELDRPPSISWQCANNLVAALVASNRL